MIERVFWQSSLFGTAPPAIDMTFAGIQRIDLDAASWIDIARGWLGGADEVVEQLTVALSWRQRTVTMYDRRLPEPRLTAWWSESHGDEPLHVLGDARTALDERYGCHFDSIGFNWYRNGRDSVAWHGDRFAKSVVNPIVAILSVGAARPFRLRPRAGGSSRTYAIGDGDLLVMGGACQHDWQHSVPKVRSAGPRISITFRHQGDEEPRRIDSHDRAQTGASGSSRQ